MAEVHRLTNKDASTLTGECSVCGLVAIRKAGNGFQCATKMSQRHKAWVSANPDKAAENRRHRSDHVLTAKDRQNMTAVCGKCGDVKLVPWGRGVICGNLAATRRTVQEASSQGTCRECWIIDERKVWLGANGVCPACAAWEPSVEARPEERRDPGGRQALELMHLGFYRYDDDPEDTDEPYGAGFSIRPEGDPYQIEDFDSAVPGWKTLGSQKPWNEVG